MKTPVKTAYKAATKVLADAIFEARDGGDLNDLRRKVLQCLADEPELSALPELGGRVAEFMAAHPELHAEVRDGEPLPPKVAAFNASLAEPPGGPRYVLAIRKSMGMSQAALGAEFGLSANTVSNWEKGFTPLPGDIMRKLIAMFGEHTPAPPGEAPFTAAEIRALRCRLGMTVTQLARVIEAQQPIVWAWENLSRTPSPKYAEKIERLLRERGIDRAQLAA